MSRYKVLLFDLDGTLMDTAPGIFSTVRYTLAKLGVEEPPQLKKFLGPPLLRSMMDYCGLDEERAWQAVRIYREKYPKDDLYNSEKFDGVEELLAGLKAEGYTLGVATSKPEPFARSLLKRFGLDKYFDYIGGSGVDGTRDNKKLVIEYVLENLGQPDRSKVLMIGDREHDIIGAGQCGIDGLYALWGYGSAEEAAECGAVFTAATPEECGRHIAAAE